MRMLPFVKMHGIGNDYVYVDGFAHVVEDPARLAVAIADRHRGVGSDGLILVLPPEPGVAADLRMRMFNADGSESEMCGNGIRCVAKFALERGLATAHPLRVQTGRGVLAIEYELDAQGALRSARVDMGEPIFDPASIPLAPARLERWDAATNSGILALPAEGRRDAVRFEATILSMGNPHATIYVERAASVDLARIGPALERHPAFPQRANIHFVEVRSPREVVMRTWERGSGITQACGTGASAVCVAGVLAGRTERSILAHLPGGDLELAWRDDGHVVMTGPATEVFTGLWPLEARTAGQGASEASGGAAPHPRHSAAAAAR
ncbi:MAG TPA: diaminopimelate epimerase [Phycisphaerales bacterium]|nr:diaminopimelate epimerase [Phycisphaerales bacterium]HMP36560.1 diaminopimelate epimerase [Phycisphaerales bacterium]